MCLTDLICAVSFRFSIAKMKLNDASYLKVLPSREMVYPLGTNLRTQEVKKSNPEPAPRDGGYRPTGPMPDGWGHHLSFALMGLVPNEYNGLLQ